MRPLDRTSRASLLSTLAAAVAGLALWSAPALGDDLNMVPPPDLSKDQSKDQSRQESSARPSRGMSMENVEAKYGAPSRKVAPVGGASTNQPPIERWEYPSFTVYFEYRKVIHSVAIAS
jgi:hypothetical protein